MISSKFLLEKLATTPKNSHSPWALRTIRALRPVRIRSCGGFSGNVEKMRKNKGGPLAV